MAEQSAIPVPPPPAERGPCAWCGKPARHDLEVNPVQRTRAKNGSLVVKKAATVVPVCDHHFYSLQRREGAA